MTAAEACLKLVEELPLSLVESLIADLRRDTVRPSPNPNYRARLDEFLGPAALMQPSEYYGGTVALSFRAEALPNATVSTTSAAAKAVAHGTLGARLLSSLPETPATTKHRTGTTGGTKVLVRHLC